MHSFTQFAAYSIDFRKIFLEYLCLQDVTNLNNMKFTQESDASTKSEWRILAEVISQSRS